MVDRWFAAFILLLACVEVAVRTDLPNGAVALAFTGVIAFAILLRRSRPLAAMSVAFGSAIALTVAEAALVFPKVAPATSVAILVMPYSLARRGTRRGVFIGAAWLAAAWLAAFFNHEMPRVSDAVGAAVVLLFPGALGLVVRFRTESQDRALAQARLLEREQLARELHDSVAHHMMAITVQAQAAQAVLAARPADAKAALSAIEHESKKALSELRGLVGALRDDGDVALVPAGRLVDLPALAARTTTPPVEVALSGDLEGLAPAIERAVFRVAQEAITNAVKHARNATKVQVHIVGEPPSVRLSVRDDGEPAATPRGNGFGLVGMSERATLLGGTFEAGPLSQGGWLVSAVFPREGRRP